MRGFGRPSWRRLLPAAELAAPRRRTARAGAGWTLVLVTENQPALLEVVGRHLDRHPVPGQCLDPVLLHFSRGVGNDLVPGIELHAIAGVGEDFGDQSFELDQLFFSHGVLQIDRRLVWLLFAVRLMVRTAFAMQKGNALYSFRLAAAMRRTAWLLTMGW